MAIIRDSEDVIPFDLVIPLLGIYLRIYLDTYLDNMPKRQCITENKLSIVWDWSNK